MPNSPIFLLSVTLLGAANLAQASTTTIQLGDIDCFGEPDDSACIAGAFPALPVVFDNTTPGDPPNTDVFGFLGTVSFDFALVFGGLVPISAEIEVRVAGVDIFVEDSIGDAIEGMGFAFNGTLIGTHFEPVVTGSDINQRAISTLVFDVSPGTLVDGGVNRLTISPEQDFDLAQFEQYAIDYASLTVEFEDMGIPGVPLPASVTLLGAAAGALVLMRRRRPSS
jgi:hypothetical protein